MPQPFALPAARPVVLDRPEAVLHYRTCGDATNPTVVLLHGATLDHRAWSPQTDALQDHYRLVLPDLRGHGTSTGRFDYTAAVDDIIALLDDIDVAQVTLVGHSLGGNIAQDVLRRVPDRITALVAADTTCNTAVRNPFAASVAITTLRTQAMLAGPGFARQAARATSTHPDVQRYALQANAHRSNRDTVDILESLLTTALRPDPAYRLPVPALLVNGEHDRIGDIAWGTRAWARREPLAQYAVVPDAGHASNLDNPAAFTALLKPFLDRLDHHRSADVGGQRQRSPRT